MKAKLQPAIVKAKMIKLIRLQEKIKEKFKELKQRCSHVGTIDYCSDPSGNNDSSYDCSVCGASFRRWPEGVPRE